MVKRPTAHEHVHRPTLERAEPGGLRHLAPKSLQGGARALDAAAVSIAMRKNRGIHGAGRCPGNAVDPQPGLFEHAVQYAPGECAVRAAAL